MKQPQLYLCQCCGEYISKQLRHYHRKIRPIKAVVANIGSGPSCPSCRKQVSKPNLRKHINKKHPNIAT